MGTREHPREWDAGTYHRVSNPQFRWGLKVLERLPLRGDEVVLDAGCGSGRLTEALLGRLPAGRVVCVDRSRQMLDEARRNLAGYGARVTFLEADLASLALASPVDAVFSTATFHWVLDHDALFAALVRALRPGGRLLAQCGGAGNLARVHARAGELQARAPYAEHFRGWTEPWRFATPEETLGSLSRAGFGGARAWLEPAPTPFPSAEALGEFLTAVVLRPHLARLPEGLRGAFVGELVARAGADPEGCGLDYVRLNLEAVRE